MTSGAIDSYTETTSFAAVEFSISCSTDGDPNSQCDSLTEVITSFPVTDTTYLSYTGSTSTLELTEILSTEVQVAELVTGVCHRRYQYEGHIGKYQKCWNYEAE